MGEPANFYMNNCKLIQELYRGKTEAMQKQEIRVGENCSIAYAFKEDFTMTYFEKIMCDAVYSIWQYERNQNQNRAREKISVVITPTDVLHWMTGKFDARINKNSDREEKMAASLDRLSQTDIVIWWGEEMKEREILGLPPILTGYFLPLVRTGKGNQFRLSLKYGLPLYSYASAIHQMIRLPFSLLACEKICLNDGTIVEAARFKNSDQMIQLRHILLQRMEMLRNPNNSFRNRKIRYDYPSHTRSGKREGLLALMGETEDSQGAESWRSRKYRLNQQVHILLDYYCKIGYLEGYENAGRKEENERVTRVIGVDLTGEIRDPEQFR